MIKIVFRALVLFLGFLVALSIIKFLFFKIFFFAVWVAAIVFLIWFVAAIVKRT